MEHTYRTERSIGRTALGVALGIVLASAMGLALRVWYVNQVMDGFKQQIVHVTETAQEQARQVAVRQQIAAEAAKQRERERLAHEVDRQRIAEEQQRVAFAAARVKEAAWNRFYKRPASCERSDRESFVECGNDYIRAKRRFEELYAAGKL